MPGARSLKTSFVFCARVGAALLCASALPLVVEAQPPADDSRGAWALSAEAGAANGGTWLEGDAAPRVRGGLGAAFSLAALHHTSPRMSVGMAVRLALQPIRVREADVSWDGGTLSDVQLLGVTTWSLRDQGIVQPQAELSAGVSLLSGSRAVYPLAGTHLAPTVAAGLSLARGLRRFATGRTLALFVRYTATRLDPKVAPLVSTDGFTAVMPTSSGWAGRASAGVRVVR